MQNGADFYVAKFLVTAGRLNVCDVAHAADIAAAGQIGFSTALQKSNYVQPGEFTVARDAVKAMEQSTVGPQIAQVLFKAALQRGITFDQALQEVTTRRSCALNDFIVPFPTNGATTGPANSTKNLPVVVGANTISSILKRAGVFH